MPAHHIDKLRIALRRPHRRGLPHHSQQETSDPQPQTEAECRRQRAVEDGNRTRRAAKQDRFGQGAMHRHS